MTFLGEGFAVGKHVRRVDAQLIGPAAVAAVLAGVTVAWQPKTIAVLLALPLVAVLARWSTARLTWFVGGGMLVFQQSDAVGASKIVYLAGAAIVAALSLVRVAKSPGAWLHAFRPLIPITTAVIALLFASLLVATSGDTATVTWVRDAFPYLLLVLAPVIALDAAHEIREATAVRLIAFCGVLAAVGFAADWLERRGVSSLPFGRILLGSGCLAALAMSTALAKVAAGQHVVRWSVVGVFIPAVMITSGARSIVAFAPALIGALGRRRHGRVGAGRAILVALVVGGGLLVLVPRLVAFAVDDPAWFGARLQSAVSVLDGDGRADLSYGQRSVAYAYAADAWHSHPWLGTGPGHAYATGSFTLDTPLLTLAKFGVIGTAILIIFLGALMYCCRAASGRDGIQPAQTAGRAFACVMLAFLPFGTPVEDKGFAFAVALGMCAVAAAARESSDEPPVGAV